jgi:hypothetical protein
MVMRVVHEPLFSSFELRLLLSGVFPTCVS